MAQTPVIQVRDLGKTYILGQQRQQPFNFREQLTQYLLEPFKRLRTLQGNVADHERFQALHALNFEINAGEVVGIIGHNGAGKSTLLKILSRIVTPSSGKVILHGRVSSLLEVGTGFHQELTGRENIFLNGAIIGMSRRDIQRQFDEIVAFAGVEQFLDTPVKRYSSGMYVRLAFAVAAHLHSDILIVDEVLAVGDAQFQKRCLNKMQNVSSTGRTVIFVSHNLNAVGKLCSRGIVLNRGKLTFDGDIKNAITHYLFKGANVNPAWQASGKTESYGDSTVKLTAVKITAKMHDAHNGFFELHEDLNWHIEYQILRDNHNTYASRFILHNTEGNTVFMTGEIEPSHPPHAQNQTIQSICKVPGNLLNTGVYTLTAILSNPKTQKIYCWAEHIVSFEMIDNINNTHKINFLGQVPGIVRPLLTWHSNKVTPTN